MKLTKAQEAKTYSVWNSENKNEKYEVRLKEGYTSNGETSGAFKTQAQVKEFINNAVYEEVDYSQMETDGNVYEGYFANHVYYTNYHTKIATAREGKFFEGFKEMRFDDLREGVEGADLLLDTVLKALVKVKDSLESGKTVNVHLRWTLSKDRMHYTSCELVRTEVVEKSVKECLESRVKGFGCVMGCWGKDMDILTDEALAPVMRDCEEQYTDIVVKMNGKQYVVEISTVDDEKDFALYTKSEYINKYGEEKEEIFE